MFLKIVFSECNDVLFLISKLVILRKGVEKHDIHFIFNFKDGKHDFSFEIGLALCLMLKWAKTFEKNCVLMFWCLF